MNQKKAYKVRTYNVRFLNGSEELDCKTYNCTKPELWKKLKGWPAAYRNAHPDSAPRFEITEVVHYKNATAFFLTKEKSRSIAGLIKSIKELKSSYAKSDVKYSRLITMAKDMWNSLQNEFYNTADICDNTIWHWQDEVAKFNDYGYMLYTKEPTALTEWTTLLSGWYNREWVIEVLKLVKEFNLDNQPTDYVVPFENDFKRVKNEEQFASALLKWYDLIVYSPWKLSLYDGTFQQPLNSHFDDEFNEDVGDDEENLDFYSQEVSHD